MSAHDAASGLEASLEAGDTQAVLALMADATEAERRAMAAVAAARLRRLHKEAAGRQGWSATAVAVMASCSMAEIEKLGRLGRYVLPDDATDDIIHVVGMREPAFRAAFAAWTCGARMAHWNVARRMVRAGLCASPETDDYVLGLYAGVWHRDGILGHASSLKAAVLANRDLLHEDIWRIFQVEGGGEWSLANHDKYLAKSGDSWCDTLVALSGEGHLDRDRLLDASLAALARGFSQYRAGWYSRFHEALRPTMEERAARLDALVGLLASSTPPTVAFALGALKAIDAHAPIEGERLIDAIEPLLVQASQRIAKDGLGLVARAAKRDPSLKGRAATAAARALLAEDPGAQAGAIDLVERIGDRASTDLRALVQDALPVIAPRLQARVRAWLGASDIPASDMPQVEAEGRVVTGPAADTSPALPPAIASLDELVLEAGAVLEAPQDPLRLERVMDGLSRLGQPRAADFARRVGPLSKRCEKILASHRVGSRLPPLRHGIGLMLRSWILGEAGAASFAEIDGLEGFMLRRLEAVASSARRAPLPLLTMPTSPSGSIVPSAVVDRWLEWQQAGVAMDRGEQVLSLLRLDPEDRGEALAKARTVEGEAGRALRVALGEGEGEVGKDADLWLAAWRSRIPQGDLPWFETKHPRLGPDAGQAARLDWRAQVERRIQPYGTFDVFCVRIGLAPEPPSRGIAPLPVLPYWRWRTGAQHSQEYGFPPPDDGRLVRWALTAMPRRLEGSFAEACPTLARSVGCGEVSDRETRAYLEPLARRDVELGPMARLAIALGLMGQTADIRIPAQDALVACVADGRFDSQALGETMARVLASGENKCCRWARSLGEASRVSPAHAAAVARLLQRALQGDPSVAARDIGSLLGLLADVGAQTGIRVEDEACRAYLGGLARGGATGKLVKQLLARA